MAKLHQPASETMQTLARARRDLYGLLSSAYIQLPEKKTLELKWEPASELRNYARKRSSQAFKEIEEGLNLVKPYGLKRDLTEGEILTNLSRDWTRLFRGVVRGGILPPYESLYRPERQQKKPVQEINRLFSAMGIQVPEEWHQPPDYIGVELDFMRLLCEREWHEREKKDAAALREVLEIEQSFLEGHLSRWTPTFFKKMDQEAHEDYYRGIARLTRGLVAFDGTYLKIVLTG